MCVFAAFRGFDLFIHQSTLHLIDSVEERTATPSKFSQRLGEGFRSGLGTGQG